MAARAVQQNTTATRDRRVITIALHFRLAVVSGFRRTVHDVHPEGGHYVHLGTALVASFSQHSIDKQFAA
jgi:hypothetical protein